MTPKQMIDITGAMAKNYRKDLFKIPLFMLWFLLTAIFAWYIEDWSGMWFCIGVILFLIFIEIVVYRFMRDWERMHEDFSRKY